ncbi:ExbD/TolR family protein [Prevotella sp. OH937_COT-195]|uniref:ExbD/TolR family protein n=1 Tax=Prevotella sp. OH937_COT-195 TaxID=2491051 RepID=UPI000F6480EB|nr:biopolymer transporter ExbD [Prevotella sp. OH937_COT-195]RRC97651.1 biopolymer transporter ExbD [Prevotella sp. OH937_COT-195]
MIFRRNKKQVPGLNTASLPDLIFTVLFFFMIVTHIRHDAPKVEYRIPQGTELQKFTKKSAAIYIYVGKPLTMLQKKEGKEVKVQVNDKYVTPAELTDYIADERSRMQPEDRRNMTIILKADRNADMGTIIDVKQALRKANALRISYSAEKEESVTQQKASNK